MKKLFTILAGLCITANVFAQAPEKMSYQAVIRNANNALVSNQSIGMRISILQGSTSGTSVYVETQTPTSNANGLISIEVGAGTVQSGVFSSINWANGPYFIQTESDPTGGTAYTITGTSQLLSVPYALHAKAADSLVGLSSADLDALLNLLPPQIGDYKYGGVVFWIDPSDPYSGLVCDVNDLNGSSPIQWYNGNNINISNSVATAIGTGQANTSAIVANQGTGNYAAALCDNLTSNGYSDWYLPSLDELNEMYFNKSIINTTSTANGGTTMAYPFYWSSSQQNGNANNAWIIYFSGGNSGLNAKGNTANVRAIRAF